MTANGWVFDQLHSEVKRFGRMAEYQARDLLPGATPAPHDRSPFDYTWQGLTVNVKATRQPHSTRVGLRWSFKLGGKFRPDCYLLVAYEHDQRVASWLIPRSALPNSSGVRLGLAAMPEYRVI